MSYHLFKAFYDIINSLDDIERRKIRILEVTNYLRAISSELINVLNKLSFEVKTKEQLQNIISISTNNDSFMTNLILEALEVKTDEDLVRAKHKEIIVSNSRNDKCYVEIIRGSKYKSGFMSNLFCNNNKKNKISVDNPYVMLSNSRINNIQEIEAILLYIKAKKKPLVIIAPEIDNAVLTALYANTVNGIVVTYPITAPGTGGTDTEEYLDDLGVMLGCKVIKSGTNYSFDNISIENASILDEVISDKCTYFESDVVSFSIVHSNKDDEAFNARIKELETEINENKNNYMLVDKLKRRISKIKDGISNIYVTSNTDLELNEKKDRIDDAIGSVKSALTEGYVYGSGLTLLKLLNMLDETRSFDVNEIVATKIIKKAFEQPFNTIFRNAEVDPNITHSYKEFIRQEVFNSNGDIEKIKNIKNGIDTISESPIDLEDSGIIDPTKVVRCAIEYSVSLVSTLISSSASILDNKEEDV